MYTLISLPLSNSMCCFYVRVNAGWSVKTQHKFSYKLPPQLTEEEKEEIVEVVKRAEALDRIEKKRIS